MWRAAVEIVRDVFWFLRRRAAKKDDPNNQNLARKQAADEAIAAGDTKRINVLVDDSLRRVRNRPKAGGDTSG